MSDDSGYPPVEPLIDVRSPAERWAESGRASLDRLQQVDRSPAVRRGGVGVDGLHAR